MYPLRIIVCCNLFELYNDLSYSSLRTIVTTKNIKLYYVFYNSLKTAWEILTTLHTAYTTLIQFSKNPSTCDSLKLVLYIGEVLVSSYYLIASRDLNTHLKYGLQSTCASIKIKIIEFLWTHSYLSSKNKTAWLVNRIGIQVMLSYSDVTTNAQPILPETMEY